MTTISPKDQDNFNQEVELEKLETLKNLLTKKKVITPTEWTLSTEDEDFNKTNYIGYLDLDKIKGFTTPALFERSFFDELYREDRITLPALPAQIIPFSDGRLILSEKGITTYLYEPAQEILKVLDAKTLEIYYKEGHPLILRDKELIYLIAPRSNVEEKEKEEEEGLDDDEEEWEESEEIDLKSELIPNGEYEQMMSLPSWDIAQFANLTKEKAKGMTKVGLVNFYYKAKGLIDVERQREIKRKMEIKGNIKGYWTHDDKLLGFELIRDETKITIIAEEQKILGSEWYLNNFLKDKYRPPKVVSYNELKVILIKGTEYLVFPDLECSFIKSYIDEAIKHFEKPKIEYRGTGFPLLIIGRKRIMAIAPRQIVKTEKERIPMNEYQRLAKLTKKELAEKIHKDSKFYSKIELIHAVFQEEYSKLHPELKESEESLKE